MRSEGASGGNHAWQAVRRWFNLGFSENQLGTAKQLSRYGRALASDNMASLPTICAFSCFLALAITVAHLILVGVAHRVAAPAFVAIVAFCVIAALSNRTLAHRYKPRAVLLLVLALYVAWFGFCMYCDIALQPFQRSILTCLAFLTLPLLFDARPQDVLFADALALAVFLVLEHLYVDVGTRMMDVLGAFIAIIVGVALSQRKTASRLNELIYLDMYKTATKTSILVAQVDLRADVFHALQLPEYMEPTVSQFTSAKAALARVSETFVSPEYQAEYNRFFEFSAIAQHLSNVDQASFAFVDYRSRWCLATVVAQARTAGQVTSAVIIVRDVNDEKRQELEYQEQLRAIAAEAKRANAAKTNFLRRMSHDIRTPINGIRGVVEIGDHFPNDVAKQAECRQKIRSSSDFLLSLVNNVLDMSKLESGAIELERKPFDLFETSHEVCSIVAAQATEHGVTVLPSDRGMQLQHRYLLGSPLHLQQILLNLGSNAVKYNRPGGTVAMGCRELSCDGNTVIFEMTCADTGLGMSREFQEHAFEPFAQEERHTFTTYTGSGLGLAIVKELVELMGGTITLESEEGRGTTFTLVLPFELDHNHVCEAQTETPTVDLAGKRALLVEDDDLNAEIAEFVLTNEGLSVQRAANGREGVDVFAAAKPGEFDMVFMDVMMPVMNGLDAARAIRALARPDAKTVPIFAMTANAFYDDERESLAAGMTAHLTKPLEIDKIRETLAKTLG